MCADDTKIYNTVKDASNKLQLQDDFYCLVMLADAWQMRFKADKCKVLHLGKNHELAIGHGLISSVLILLFYSTEKQDYSKRRHGCNERAIIEKADVERGF
jgi:hypothetical protein